MIRTPTLGLLISLFFWQASQAQEWAEKWLHPVQEGQFLSDSAWLVNTAGDTVYYESFKGKWLLIDYWMSGCRPCMAEFPALEAYHQNRDTSKLRVISLSVDSKIKSWHKSRKRYSQKIPAYYAGRLSQNAFLSLNFKIQMGQDSTTRLVTYTPQYVLIDPQGQIVDKALPKPSGLDFTSKLDSYLKRP